jgi:L-malate glycosyltransferase
MERSRELAASYTVLSPMSTGNGAHVVHKALEARLPNYSVYDYHPYWTLIPPSLWLMARGRKPSIIHTSPDYGLFFQRTGVPLVITLHNYVLDDFMRRFSSPAQRVHYRTDLKWFTALSLRRANRVVSVSHFTAELVKRELKFDRKIDVIHNGVDISSFRPPSSAHSRSGKDIVALYSGNLSLRKGVFLVPQIASRLNPHIHIQYTRGLRTRFSLPASPTLVDIGSVSYSAMPDLYRNVDILLFPTVREGLSLAVLEAMASGLPIVATNCSSLPELVIHEKGGFLCEIGDPSDFAEKINRLAESPSLRREMGEFNRTRVEEMFTVHAMASRYRDLFNGVFQETRQQAY